MRRHPRPSDWGRYRPRPTDWRVVLGWTLLVVAIVAMLSGYTITACLWRNT